MRSQPASPALREPSLGESVDFLRVLWAVDHALQKASKRMARRLGVTGPQRLAIRIVGGMPGISAGELAAVLCVDPSTLTGVLKRLRARRLVAIRPDPRDRRRSLLSLTAAGRERNRRMQGTVEAGVRRALAVLSRRDVAVSAKVLRQVTSSLTKQTLP